MPIEQVARAGKPGGKFAAQTGIAAPEAADTVAEAIVPLGKSGRMMAQLIAAGADVPRLGDQLHARESGILAERIEEAATRVETVGLAAERHAKIEAKSIDMVMRHPIAQRVHDHLEHT